MISKALLGLARILETAGRANDHRVICVPHHLKNQPYRFDIWECSQIQYVWFEDGSMGVEVAVDSSSSDLWFCFWYEGIGEYRIPYQSLDEEGRQIVDSLAVERPRVWW